MPWKAGRGVTHEIAIGPTEASIDDFSWRLSIATIDRSTTFSAFAGYDRTLLLLDGPGARTASSWTSADMDGLLLASTAASRSLASGLPGASSALDRSAISTS